MKTTVPFEGSVAAKINLEPILVKLCHPTRGLGWGREQATRAIDLYRKWLYLHQIFPDESFSPSQEIDQVWHTHMLDNRKYEVDCKDLFGKTLYHNPYAGMFGLDDEQAQQVRFEHTQKRFAELFPQMTSALIGHPLCSSGYCDTDVSVVSSIVRPTMKVLELV